ncbi:MAG: hypothetical protein IKC26_06180 [Clostridia bacterium]|nr:hypothetical protein [Clostridia bacterium]
MKKLLCLLLVLCVLFCVGCTNTQGGDETSADASGGEHTPQWHLSETVEDELMIEYDIGVVTPLVYEKTINDIFYRVEFFEEFYPIGSLMQVRITMTNDSDNEFVYDATNMLGLIYQWGDYEVGRSVKFFPVHEPEGQEIDYSVVYIGEGIERTLPVGGTIVFERALRVTPEFFIKGEYVYGFPVFGEGYDTVKIPLEVVNRNEQKAQ